MKMRSVRLCLLSVSLCVTGFLSGCSTLADAKAGKGTGISQSYPVAVDRVWQVLPAAVKLAGIDYVTDNKAEGFALAQRGLTAFSYGENVAIFVDSVQPQVTKVEVVSKKALATTIFATDWAKPILDKIAELIK